MKNHISKFPRKFEPCLASTCTQIVWIPSWGLEWQWSFMFLLFYFEGSNRGAGGVTQGCVKFGRKGFNSTKIWSCCEFFFVKILAMEELMKQVQQTRRGSRQAVKHWAHNTMIWKHGSIISTLQTEKNKWKKRLRVFELNSQK